MQIFNENYFLTYSHIDWRGVSRPSAFFDFMQDGATRHARILHIDSEDVNALWVLSSMHLQLKRPLTAYETVHMETYCAGIKGARWLRAFDFTVGGEIIGRAISTWVTLDAETHAVLRPSSIPFAAHYEFPDRPVLPVPGKLVLGELPLHHTHPVMYSDVDVNRHLNNAKIAALVSDCLDLSEHEFVRDLQINYTAETAPDTLLSLCAARDGKLFSVRGEAGGKVRFEASGQFGIL